MDFFIMKAPRRWLNISVIKIFVYFVELILTQWGVDRVFLY